MSFYKDKLIHYNLYKDNYKFDKYLKKTNQHGGFYNKQLPIEFVDKLDKICIAYVHASISNNEFILDNKTYLLIPFAEGCPVDFLYASAFTGVGAKKISLKINDITIDKYTNINELITSINKNIKINKLVDIDGTKYQLLQPGDTTCDLDLEYEYNISGMTTGTFNPRYDYLEDFNTLKFNNNLFNIKNLKKAMLIMCDNGNKNIKCDLSSLLNFLNLNSSQHAKTVHTISNIINMIFNYILCHIKEVRDYDVSNLTNVIMRGIGNFFRYIFFEATNIDSNDITTNQPLGYLKFIFKNNFNKLFSYLKIIEIIIPYEPEKHNNKKDIDNSELYSSIDEIIIEETRKIINQELYSKYKKFIKHEIISLLFLTVLSVYDIDKIYNLKPHKTLYDLINHISVNTPIDKINLIISGSCRTSLNYNKISKCISYSCITQKIINLITNFNEKNNLLLNEIPDNQYITSGVLSISVFIENIFTIELNYKKLIEETIRYIDLLDIKFMDTVTITPTIRKNFDKAIEEIYGTYIDDKYVNIIIESSKNYSNYRQYGKVRNYDTVFYVINFIKIIIKHVLFNLIHLTMKDELILNNYDYLNDLIETKYPILKNNDIVIFINKINETNPILSKELLILFFNVFIKANKKMIIRFSK